jgi:hypothetical protein
MTQPGRIVTVEGNANDEARCGVAMLSLGPPTRSKSIRTRPFTMHRYFIGLCSLIVSSTVFSIPSKSQTEAILATMDRLLINLPMSVAGRDPVNRFLDELSRERCDQQAIANLGVALDKLG